MRMLSKLFVLFGIVILAGCISGPKITERSSSVKSTSFGDGLVRDTHVTYYEIEGVEQYYLIAQVPFSSEEFADFLEYVDSDTQMSAVQEEFRKQTVYFGYSRLTDTVPYMIFWHDGDTMWSVSNDAAIRDLDVMMLLLEFHFDSV